jgi:hypothetical protein
MSMNAMLPGLTKTDLAGASKEAKIKSHAEKEWLTASNDSSKSLRSQSEASLLRII